MFENLHVISNQDINTTSKPVFAIVGYEGENGYADLKYFPIENNSIGAEIPFDNECLIDLKESVNTIDATHKKELCFKSIIPKNIVCFQNNNIIWTVNETKKHLYFDNDIKLNDGYYHLPKLLFAFINKTLFVYAIKNGAIQENTELFNAPFLNVYQNGSICMGNVNTDISKFSYIEDAIQYLESAFFKSIFTHTNHNKIIKGNIISYFQELKNTSFNSNKLLPSTKKSLINLINNI